MLNDTIDLAGGKYPQISMTETMFGQDYATDIDRSLFSALIHSFSP